MDLYLRISPELYLKRCLVGGLERVYEFARCFRNEGISPRHNPEFTMLELYQAYGDYHDMMEITEEIIAGAARQVMGSYRIATKPRSHEATKGDPSREPPDPSRDREGAVGAGNATSAHAVEIDFTPPWPRRRYVDLVREYSGVDIRDRAAVLAKANDLGILAKFQKAHAAIERGADPAEVRAPGMEQLPDPQAVEVDHALLVNAIFEEEVEHHLMNPTFVVDYPAELCPLTKRHPSDPALALRFEAYIHGMEMGNAYSELNDPAVQLENLQHHVKGEGDETMRVMDEDFVEALEYAMPPAGGLGIGIDRLCMLLTGSASIRDVLLFPLQRPQA
jgi:lysyl-tRNA synthetase class 2